MKVVLQSLTDKVTGVVYTPPIPVNLTELYTIDHETATVFARNVTIEEIKQRWQGLPDELDARKPEELLMDINFTYQHAPFKRVALWPPETPKPLPGSFESDDWKTYDDSHDRFGWRKPGMHVRKVLDSGVVHTHGPGKRKKGKRK